MASKSVIVVGAGIAGLTAAYRLCKNGMDVVVLEASGRVGGRMSTDRRGGYLMDRGAQFLSDGYTVIGGLIGELGLADRHAHTSGWSGIVRDGVVRRFNARYPWTVASSGLLSWRDTFRVAHTTLMHAWRTRGLSLSDYSQWHVFDDADAAEWIAVSFGDDALEYLFEPMLEGFYFQAPEGMSRAWPAVVWSFGARGKSATALADGIGSLPEAMAKHVEVRLATPVESVKCSGAGVRIDTPAESIQADFAVLATTAPVARKLLPPGNEVEMHLLDIEYSSSINISLAVPKGVSSAKVGSDLYGLLIPRKERRVVAAVAFESHKSRSYVPAGELLNVMLSHGASRRLLEAPEERVLAEVLSELRHYFPGIDGDVTFAHFSRWKEAEPRSPVGRSRDLHRYRRMWQPSMKVILAGDYMSIPCTEGAAESGAWAAGRLMKAADAGP